LVVGAAGSTTEELQQLYDAVAPVAYRGLLDTPISSRRYRRDLLADLERVGVISHTQTPRGRIWAPSEDVLNDDDLAERFRDDDE
jgi:hypothetical protein